MERGACRLLGVDALAKPSESKKRSRKGLKTSNPNSE